MCPRLARITSPGLGPRRAAAGLFALLALGTCASPALAGLTITQGQNFSLAGPTSVAFLGITPFDPALGTLDSVEVEIQGTLVVQGRSSPGSPFQISVSQD